MIQEQNELTCIIVCVSMATTAPQSDVPGEYLPTQPAQHESNIDDAEMPRYATTSISEHDGSSEH